MTEVLHSTKENDLQLSATSPKQTYATFFSGPKLTYNINLKFHWKKAKQLHGHLWVDQKNPANKTNKNHILILYKTEHTNNL